MGNSTHYTDEFKERLKLEYQNTNMSYTELGKKYDITPSLLRRWGANGNWSEGKNVFSARFNKLKGNNNEDMPFTEFIKKIENEGIFDSQQTITNEINEINKDILPEKKYKLIPNGQYKRDVQQQNNIEDTKDTKDTKDTEDTEPQQTKTQHAKNKEIKTILVQSTQSIREKINDLEYLKTKSLEISTTYNMRAIVIAKEIQESIVRFLDITDKASDILILAKANQVCADVIEESLERTVSKTQEEIELINVNTDKIDNRIYEYIKTSMKIKELPENEPIIESNN